MAVLAVPGAVVAWGRSTATFTTERITVSGTQNVAKKEARRALEGAFLGENLFAIGGDDVRRALRRECYLADVAIDRDFPDTLRVRLVEHRPALAVLAHGRWYVVSASGHVICEIPAGGAQQAGKAATAAGEGGGTPATEPAGGEDDAAATESAGAEGDPAAADGDGGGGASRGTGTLDEGPAGKAERALPRLSASAPPEPGAPAASPRIRAAVATLAGLPKGLRRQVALLDVSKSLRVTATLDDGLEVHFGDPSRLGDKVIALRAVGRAYRAEGRSPVYVDVSVPERPLGRPLLK